MGDIVLSSAVRNSLSSLQSTADLLAQTNNRLSTGLKVSSPIDNPTSFFTAQGLNNRASDLETLQDNIGLSVETLNAAAAGIDSLSTLVEQAKSTANTALNTKITAATTSSSNAYFAGNATAEAVDVGTGIDTGDTISVSVDGAGSATVTIAATTTQTGVVAQLDAITGLSASISGGVLVLEAASGGNVTIADTAGSAASTLGLTSSTNGVNRNSLVTDYNNLLDQIDQLAGDASFNGVNLLNGDDLTAKFNEDGSSTLSITGVTFNAAGLSLSDTTATAFASDSGIDAVVASLDAATGTLRSQSSTFGNNLAVVENRQQFTNSLIQVLEAGAGGLTLADTNEEGANLLALQTRQALGTTALSLSSQQDQSVLSFIR